MTLNDYLKEARDNGQAIGHFNFATIGVARVIVEGAKEAGALAVMLGTSEGEAGFVGMDGAVAITKVLAKHYNFPVFLNADHYRSVEKCKEAIDLGYDSVILDPVPSPSASNGAGPKDFFNEKVKLTKEVVEYAHSKNANISIEGELGYLKGSSQIQSKIEISPSDYTKPEEAKNFVDQTGVDRLAVVFGNIHGIVKEVVHKGTAPTPGGVGVPTETSGEEKLDIEHFKKIVAAAPNVSYVLHGASGLSDDDVRAAIKAGVSNVHFNTELRIAYKEALHKEFHDEPDQTTPYKYLEPALDEVKRVVVHKTKLFLGR